jgi:hypothetical protein
VRLSAIALLAVLPLAAAPASAAAAKVKPPRAGDYIGETEKNQELALEVSGRRAQFEIQCVAGERTVTVRHLRLHRTSRGYSFAAHGRVELRGRFARTGTKAHGRVAIKSKRCHTRKPVRWTARRWTHGARAPRSGEYDGETAQHRGITLIVSGRSIQLATFGFACGNYGEGRTNLDGVALRRTRKGYAFSIKSHGSVTYGDVFPDENAEVDLSGRFNRAGKRASGHIRVKSPRCGGTGQVPFTVTPAKSG